MILAVESSCDESALATWDPTTGELKEHVLSQMDLHAQYGGVVPELASREHLKAFPLLLRALLKERSPEEIRLIAVTKGPGLAPCLALGIAFAKALHARWGIPITGENHLRAHLFSPFITLFEGKPQGTLERLKPYLPHLGLLVSGGNTLLARYDGEEWSILAQTEDDAAGEALDKGAKLLGLPYPGGPQVEKMAETGIADRYRFPDANDPRLRGRFSYSGLKTSLRYQLEKMTKEEVLKERPSLCRAYQQAVVGQLLRRAGEELESGDYRSLGLSGGVANNRLLREEMRSLATRHRLSFFPAQTKHTGDNASMIAFTAWLDQLKGLPVKEPVLSPSLPADKR